MSGFDDFIEASILNQIPVNDTLLRQGHVVGTDLDLTFTPFDNANNTINWSTGFTAAWTPYVDRTVALATWTHTSTAGRQIVLGNGFIAIRATGAASQTAFSTYAGRTAKSTLIVTRTSDGKSAALFVKCNLPLVVKLNP